MVRNFGPQREILELSFSHSSYSVQTGHILEKTEDQRLIFPKRASRIDRIFDPRSSLRLGSWNLFGFFWGCSHRASSSGTGIVSSSHVSGSFATNEFPFLVLLAQRSHILAFPETASLNSRAALQKKNSFSSFGMLGRNSRPDTAHVKTETARSRRKLL